MNPIAKVKEKFKNLESRLASLEAVQQPANQVVQLQDAVRAMKEELASLKILLDEASNEDIARLQDDIRAMKEEFSSFKTFQHEMAVYNEKQKNLDWYAKFFYDCELAKRNMREVESLVPGNGERLKKLENRHKGQRCFVIGNGPSLTIDDLNLISRDVTFAANRIYEAFSDTDWRPTYYSVTDSVFFDYFHDLTVKTCRENMPDTTKLFWLNLIKDIKEPLPFCDEIYFDLNMMHRDVPEFSKRADLFLYRGSTIIYVMIQLAVYMGFDEIYLLGVDNDFPTQTADDGREVLNPASSRAHFYKESSAAADYLKNIMSWVDFRDTEKSGLHSPDSVYRTAKWHCDQLNVSLYNATRGGKLEVLTRKNLDEIIEAF